MGTYAIITGKMLQIGDQLDQYQIQAHMAQGGMSDVYKAYDLIRKCDVVIKIPDQTMIGDPAQYERFQRELEVLKSLDHPAILHGLGSGKYNRIPYLVTEYVNGESLRNYLNSKGTMSVEETIPIIRKIADGMVYCHEHGVIHRDLKPENIFITSELQPIIMDFGLALTKGSHRVTYSNLSATMGTPDYMAPEQIEGKRGDQRTDIYALGTIYYEMLAGQPPFSGDTNLAVMAQHLNNTAPLVNSNNPSIPNTIAAIIAKTLARNPEDRYLDMQGLIKDLDNPQSADLSILDQKKVQSDLSEVSLLRAETFKAIGIALVIMVAIVILALALQHFKP